MLNRYDGINHIKNNKDGKRVYKTIFYPKIEEFFGDIYYMAKETDRLDLLANTYYKDPTLWWIIAHCNKIKGTFFIEPGTQIRIPMNVEKIVSDFKQLNMD